MSFILDPTSLPQIINLYQNNGSGVLEIIFSMTRTFAHGLHRKKLIIIGKWPYSNKNENCYPSYNATVAGDLLGGPDVPDNPPGVAGGADQCGPCVHPAARPAGGEATRPEVPGVAQGAASVSHPSAGPRQAGGAVPRPVVPDVPPGPPARGDDADQSGAIAAYHTEPSHQHQEPAMPATVRPEQGGWPGWGGHAGALDHLDWVVDGSHGEMSSLHNNNGNPPTCGSSNSAVVYANITHSVDTPWLSSVRPFQCLAGLGFFRHVKFGRRNSPNFQKIGSAEKIAITRSIFEISSKCLFLMVTDGPL